MTAQISGLFFAFFSFFSMSSALAKNVSLVVDSSRESVRVVLPDDFKPTQKYPIVISLHGYGGSAKLQEFYFALNTKVNTRQFILATPGGLKNSADKQFWNASPVCCDFEKTGVDDVGFLNKLADDLIEKYSGDASKVSFVGHSNGGYMSYRMACERPNVYSISTLAGSNPFEIEKECKNQNPVSVLQIHGTKDDTVKYDGGEVGSGFSYPSALESVSRWAKRNSCVEELNENAPSLDLVSHFQIRGLETTRRTWGSCHDNKRIELWSILNGVHTPVFRLDGYIGTAILDFVLQ